MTNREKKLTLFWLGNPELPNEIKGLISEKYWDDVGVMRESQDKEFSKLFQRLHGRLYGVLISISVEAMELWGIHDHNELPKVYDHWPKKIPGTYISVGRYYHKESKTERISIQGNQERVVFSSDALKANVVWGERPVAILKRVPNSHRTTWFQ
jgi:hypothetical protein